MTELSLFDEEEKTLQEGEELTDSGADPETGWPSHFRLLLTKYKKLLGHARRLTNIGDLMQNDLKHLTERLRQANEFQAGLLATAATGIFSVDADRAIDSVSDAFCNITGFRGEELIGKQPESLGFQPCEGTIEPFDCCLPLPVFGRAYTMVAKDGRILNTLVNSAPMKDDDGAVVGGIVSFVDVTDLMEARKAAQAADRAKSEFLAVVSHEIRTPINGIVGMTELALGTELTAEQRGYLSAVQTSAETLLKLINDILDLSRIEAGKLEVEHVEFSLRDCVAGTMRALSVPARAKGLELILRVPPDMIDRVSGDPRRLGQVLTNLVSNAIKFTDHGEIFVRLSMESPKADEVSLHFSVADTGVGISPLDQGRIFGSFERARTPKTRARPGTGLGLSISANLVQMMGGTIWVESRPGDGSTFHFTIRLAVASRALPKYEIPKVAKLADLRVLVVDDNANVRVVLEEMLQHLRIHPTAVDGGRAALAALKSSDEEGRPFHLILLDATVEDLDCLYVSESTGQFSIPSYPPGVMLTSVGGTGGTGCFGPLRIAAFLSKPVEQRALVAAIFTALDMAPATPEQSAPVPLSAARKPSRRLDLLLAEDNQISQQVAATMLRKMGHTVTIANNGVEAVSAFEKHAFDLILMDVEMPEMRGVEATGAIRERESLTGKHIPIVAMTAHAMEGDKETFLRSGMDDYIAKPVSVKVMMETIERLLPLVRSVHDPGEDVSAKDSAFDKETLMEQVCGDRTLLKRIVSLFVNDSKPVMAQMSVAVNSGNSDDLRKTAHKLRGMVGAVAAGKAEEAAFRLESIGRSGDLSGAGEAIKNLGFEVDRLRRALVQFESELDL